MRAPDCPLCSESMAAKHEAIKVLNFRVSVWDVYCPNCGFVRKQYPADEFFTKFFNKPFYETKEEVLTAFENELREEGLK